MYYIVLNIIYYLYFLLYNNVYSRKAKKFIKIVEHFIAPVLTVLFVCKFYSDSDN